MIVHSRTDIRPLRMHTDEVIVRLPLVKRLIADQFPQWKHLIITPVPYSGTDNAIFRLGEHMVVRLPRIHWATDQVHKEDTWLPLLAPNLPLQIPTPLGTGGPAFGYPWHWAVHNWLEGQNAIDAEVDDPVTAALDLAAFISTLNSFNIPPHIPAPTGNRGGPLAERDADVRTAIASLEGEVNVQKVTTAWETSLDTPTYQGEPALIHADITPGNILVNNGKITAIIDFGLLTTGDPACDLIVAWNYLNDNTRNIFRTALSVDDATWSRARGWALSGAIIALPYYLNSNPQIVAMSRRIIHEVLQNE